MARLAERARGRVGRRVLAITGGRERARVIVVLAGVLALASADAATIGAVSADLEPALGISNTQLGILSAAALAVAALAVLPIGWLVDRSKRVRILGIGVVVWSLAMAAGGVAADYSQLLFSRVGLGAVAATAGPAIASLTGDYFEPGERARVYGLIISGEIAGSAFGFIVSGEIAGLLSWRFAFFGLAVCGLALARFVFSLPEPERGGRGRIPVEDDRGLESPSSGDRDAERDPATEAVRRRRIPPRRETVIAVDPAKLSTLGAFRLALIIPTNRLLIAASSLGYFFFAGLSTFALVFIRGQYDLGQEEATGALGLLIVGGLVGVLLGGRIADARLASGRITARVRVPAFCYALASVLLIPSFFGDAVIPWVLFAAAGTGAITAASPPLDAARLDIVPSALWGRTESVRSAVRNLAQAAGPLVFGIGSDLIGGTRANAGPSGIDPGTPTAGVGHALGITFTAMLITLAAAAWLMWRSRLTYARDVASADRSQARAG